MKKRAKSIDQIQHAKTRLRTRMNVEGTNNDVENKLFLILKMINEKKCKVIDKQSRRVIVYKVNHEQVSYFPVYDKQRNTIVTFLTKEMLEERGIYC